MEGNIVAEEVEVWALAIVEAFQIAVLLFIRPSGIGLVDYALHYPPHVLVVPEGSLKVGFVSLVGQSAMVHIRFLSELSIIEHLPVVSVFIIDN